MSHFDGITLAFSHKDRVWRTRYSFTPTAYGYVDNFMLSSNGRHPSSTNDSPTVSNGFWRHDTNALHNRFYGFQYDMGVSFVANYNPSSVKIFKSLSAESNSNSWTGFVSTNSNPSGGATNNEYQTSQLSSFTRKEGASYVDIKGSTTNSTSNVSAGFNAEGGVGFNLVNSSPEEIGLSPVNPILTWEENIEVQHGQITAGTNCFVVVSSQSGLSYIRGNELIPIDSATPSYQEGYVIVKSLNSDDQTVTLEMIVPADSISSYPFSWSSTENFDGSLTSNTVYIDTPSITNGDYMRGRYMNVYLSNNSTAPVECFAFNVNYEPTRFDHSLGQNA